MAVRKEEWLSAALAQQDRFWRNVNKTGPVPTGLFGGHAREMVVVPAWLRPQVEAQLRSEGS
jgi:hypothetical protein